MKNALFIDRDGVMNLMARSATEGFDSPQSVEQVELVEGVAEVIAYCNGKGIPVIEISNQPSVAKGKMSIEHLEAIEARVHQLLADQGAKVDATYRCLHHPKAVVASYLSECDCRKPKPGLLLQAAKEMSIDLTNSVFLGDNLSDMEAGQAAGCKTIFFFHENDTPIKVEKNRAYKGSPTAKTHEETLAILKGMFEEQVTAIIVAGGQGTRLRPLTNDKPKPMVPVAGKPILEHTLNLFKKHGVTRFIFALCYLPQSVIDYFGDGSKFGVSIEYTFEDPSTPLGTAGAILGARGKISGTFIVTYADVLRDLDIAQMLKKHRELGGVATLNTYPHSGGNFKSFLEFDSEDHRLTAFTELPESRILEEGKSIWSNGSFYIFEPAVFQYIKEGEPVDFARNVFPALMSDDQSMSVFPTNGYFIDIGTLETLKRAEDDVKNGIIEL